MPKVTRAKDEPWPVPLLRSQGADLDPKLKEALTAYDAIRADPAAADRSIAPMVRAALDPHVAIHETATQLLAHLTGDHEAARVAVTKMAAQSNWQYRFNALLSLGPSTPRDFATETVRTLLEDKSTRVREKAADQALRLGLANLGETLREAADRETSDTVVKTLVFSMEMLRDGYIVKPGNDGFWVTVWRGDGAIGKWYSQADFERQGLDDILRALREGSGTR